MTQSHGRFFTATVFFFAGTVCLFLALRHPEGWLSVAAVVVSYLLVALNLFREGREDPDAVLLWLGGVLLAAAFVLGVYLFSAYRPGPLPKLAAAGTSLLGLAALAWTWKRQTAPPGADLPDHLRDLEPRLPIRETNRVQFTTLLRPGGGTEPHWVELTFQNCGSAPRTVGFQFHGPLLRKVKVPVPARVELGPAEVMRLSLPMVTAAKPGPTAVDLLIPVRGNGGKRVRLRRAWSSQARSLDPIAKVRLLLDPLPEALWEAEFPASHPEILWKPQPGTLPA